MAGEQNENTDENVLKLQSLTGKAIQAVDNLKKEIDFFETAIDLGHGPEQFRSRLERIHKFQLEAQEAIDNAKKGGLDLDADEFQGQVNRAKAIGEKYGNVQKEQKEEENNDSNLYQIAEEKIKSLEKAVEGFDNIYDDDDYDDDDDDEFPIEEIKKGEEEANFAIKGAQLAINEAKKAGLETSPLQGSLDKLIEREREIAQEYKKIAEQHHPLYKTAEEKIKQLERARIDFYFSAMIYNDSPEKVKNALELFVKCRDEAQNAINNVRNIPIDPASLQESYNSIVQHAGQDANDYKNKRASITTTHQDSAVKIAQNIVQKTKELIESAQKNKSDPDAHTIAQEAYMKAMDEAQGALKKCAHDGDKISVRMINFAIQRSHGMTEIANKKLEKPEAKIPPNPKPKLEAGAKAGGEPKPESQAKVYAHSDIVHALGDRAGQYKIAGDENHAIITSIDGKMQFTLNPKEVKAFINLTGNKEAAEDMLKMTVQRYNPPYHVITKDPAEGAFLMQIGKNMDPPVNIDIFESEEKLKSTRKAEAAAAKVEDKKEDKKENKKDLSAPDKPKLEEDKLKVKAVEDKKAVVPAAPPPPSSSPPPLPSPPTIKI